MVDYEKSSYRVNIICEETVRYSFVSHLSAALRREDISVSVFADTDLDEHNQGTRVSVVVFSETDAFSLPWLNNFAKVLELHKNNGHEVVPVFYGVSLSVLNRNHDWLRMLLETGDSAGHQSGNSSNMIRSDSELVKEIVRTVYGKLSPTERIGIYMRVMEIENLLCEQPWGVRSLGIWGMPGIGKTTLAKAVFDHMSSDYDASCFIEDFDEALHKVGSQRLLEEKMGKILEKKFGASSFHITRLSLLKDKLCDTRILLVLDDVCNPLVAESFLGRLDWFGPGSLIIFTSRYKQVFSFCQISQIYEVQGLNKHEALQLFSLSAFEKDVPEQNDKELSTKVIDYANGNPLALRIYGQELKGKKSKMEATFLKLKQCPPQKIQDRLKSVYSALGDNEKYIFLDIACFFKGENVNYVVQMLEGCGYFPRVGIDVLVDKCLVTISENTLHINDLIQDIFREILVGEKIQMERCTTLWQPSSIRYLLEDDELKADGEPKETPKCLLVARDIEGISLDTSKLILDVYPDAFKKMVSLRFLKVYNSYSENVPGLNFPKGLNSLPCELRLLHWEYYPFESLPQGFDLRELVELNMPYSQLKSLCAITKNLEMLKRIKLCHSLQLVNFSIHAHNIELIDLQGCTRLESFLAMTKLQHLRVLNLSGCINIKIVPELPLNIEELYLQGTSIEQIPISIVARSSQPNCKELMNHIKHFPGLEHIDLDSVTNMIKVISYNQGAGKLVRLNMKDCLHLRSLPDMFSLESLQVLDLSGCSSLEEIKGFPRNMKELYLAGTCIQELPEFPESLEFLNAHGCHLLKSVHLDFEQLPRQYIFSNCFNLSIETTVDFLETSLTRVIRLVRERNQEHIKAPAFNICFPAGVCQYRRRRSSFHWPACSFAMVELAPCMRKGLSGFVMSVSVSFWDDCHNIVGLGIRCICTWKTRNGHSDNIEKLERVFKCWAPTEAPRVEKDHLFVFYDAEMHPGAGEEKDSNIADDEIKFDFHTVSGDNIPLGASCMVTECGVKVITGDKSVSKTTRESETMSIIEEEDCPPFLREPEAMSSVSKTTRESETMSITEEEDAPPLPREPEATSSVSKTTRESETMSITEEEDAPPLPKELQATSSVGKTTRESGTMSITEEEDAPPLPRDPEATSSVSKTTRESETMSIIEEEDAPLSSSEPHNFSSMPNKVRSKRTVFWKWVGCFPLPPKNLKFRRRRTRVLEEAFMVSKEKGKIKQVADDQVDEKGQIKHSKDHVEEDVNSLCYGCNSAIEDGISLTAFGAVWHPQCLCCLHCREPIAVHEIPHLNNMFHKPCYKEHRLQNCYVCGKKIPRTERGVVYHAHPFWGKKYCPSHDGDGTPKCCSCERLEHRGTHYVMLGDGRWLCRECMECAVMDTDESQALHYEIREFFVGLNMKIEKQFPLLLVEKEVLNKAEKDEKTDYQYELLTRGICLSEEQIITSVSKGPRMGPNNQLIDMVIEPQRVVRECEVTAILILYGLPRLLTGYILAHEMMHAWLRLNGYRNFDTVLEEGLCQVLGHMWLESQTYDSSDSAATDFSSSHTLSTASTSNNGDETDFEKKLVEFCKFQIETDESPVFGLGFRKVYEMMRSNDNNLRHTLKDIASASKKTNTRFELLQLQ